MLIFGGETTDGALHNTMWRFDLGKEMMQYRMVTTFLTTFRIWTVVYRFCDEGLLQIHQVSKSVVWVQTYGSLLEYFPY